MEASAHSSRSDRLCFVVPGVPVPCARGRAVPLMRNGRPVLKDGRPIIIVHTEDKTDAYEKHVATCALAAAVSSRWEKPEPKVRLGLVIRVYRVKRTGDWDNYAKGIADGITKSGRVWSDDRYVVSANIAMAVSRANPRVEVEVRVLDAPSSSTARQGSARQTSIAAVRSGSNAMEVRDG